MTGFQSKRQMAQEKTSMKDEALKLALEALEASHFLIHGNETKGGLAFCMDGYYSGCFDIDSNDKQTNEAITSIREALAQPVQPNEADELLTALGLDPDTYRTDGGWLNIPKIMAAIKSPQDYPHLEHVLDSSCWCNPEVNYVDPDTGAAVIVHKEPN